MRLVNMYGITETTVHVTHRLVTAADLTGDAVSPIGRALGDLTVHVLDRHLRPVPIGATGEMYVGGAGLARGYLGRPGLTAGGSCRTRSPPSRGAALPHRRPGPPPARRRTGVPGTRRRPGEDPGAPDRARRGRGRAAASFRRRAGRRGGPGARSGEHRLHAYLVVGAGLTGEELRRWLRDRLPEAMVPATFTVLPALPLTANGR
ncbi:AMP-binding protein [Micromonospora sp. BRA006-A]|nr:AMP-binding protein [Micromonospora sp. BRA006-A]